MASPRWLRPNVVMTLTALVAASSMVLTGTSRAQFAGRTASTANVFEAAPVFPYRDITVTAVDAPSPVGVGGVVTVRAGVANQEATATGFDLVLTDLTDGSVLDTVPVSLAGFETRTIDLAWDTGGAALGDHDLQVEAVVAGDLVPGDNVATATVRLEEAVYDLRVRRVTAPSPVGVGEQVQVEVQVQNDGNLAIDFDLVLRDTTAAEEIETRSVTLGTGESAWFLFTWDSSEASLGNHRLQAEAALAGDASPGNNRRSKNVKVEAAERDVRVTAVAASSPASQGNVVSVEIDLWNRGNVTTTFDLVLRDATEGLIIETNSVTLAGWRTGIVVVEWDTATASLGLHTLEAEAVVVDDSRPSDNRGTTGVVVDP